MRICLFTLLVACTPKPEQPVAAPVVERPAWVNTGSGYVVKDGKRVFIGVGVATNIKNKALKKDMASNRARAEISKQFETFTAMVMKDYTATPPTRRAKSSTSVPRSKASAQ